MRMKQKGNSNDIIFLKKSWKYLNKRNSDVWLIFNDFVTTLKYVSSRPYKVIVKKKTKRLEYFPFALLLIWMVNLLGHASFISVNR